MENETIIVKSKKNNSTYVMHENMIIVCGGDKEYTIELPKRNNILCFYDMYYTNSKLIVIIATSGSYDIRYELDETSLNLQEIAYSK